MNASSILRPFREAALCFLALTALTGLAYPVAVYAAAQMLFPRQAEGSIVEAGGKAVASELIGQSFTRPKYFWGRPSATGPVPYAGQASSGSNLGPTNPALAARIDADRKRLDDADPAHPAVYPVDLLTASGSGLDPHLSPAAAAVQIPRVARARGLKEAEVRTLVEKHVESRQFGLLGEPRVNVVRLNHALDALRP